MKEQIEFMMVQAEYALAILEKMEDNLPDLPDGTMSACRYKLREDAIPEVQTFISTLKDLKFTMEQERIP